MWVFELKGMLFLIFASSCYSLPFSKDACKDLADGSRKQYDWEVVNECYECEWVPMGMRDFTIADDSIFSTTGDPQMSRLGNPAGAWCASGNPADYIEVDFGGREVKFGGFDIQGFDSSWVTVFKVSYKDASGVYKFVNDEEGNEKFFDGNSDADMIVKRSLQLPVYATSVRLYPVASQKQACLRFELFSCKKDEPVALSDPVFESEPSAIANYDRGNVQRKCTFDISKNYVDRCIKYKKDIDNCNLPVCVEKGAEGKFESDIELDPDTREALERALGMSTKGNQKFQRGASAGISRWTDYKSGDNFLVPYTISSGFSSYDTGVIQSAIDMIAKNTCVRLVRRSNQPYYIRFQRGGGCSSPVGKSRYTPNKISLGIGCVYTGTVAHEILHSLGFWHEQSRPDRDSYVTIQWQNIQRGLEYNFQKRTQQEINSFGSPYDIGSIMHYHSTAFSVNGQPTILDKQNQRIRTQRTKLSQEDIKQINRMYNCKKTGGGQSTTTAKPITPTTAPPSTCKDEQSSCSYWAGKGYCKSSSQYYSYMKKNCKKSCDLCTTGNGCKDRNGRCSGWLKYCKDTMYIKYMEKNCPATCGSC